MSHTEWGVRWWEGDNQIERTVDFGKDKVEALALYTSLVNFATPERRTECPLRKHDAELLLRVVPDWTVSLTA